MEVLFNSGEDGAAARGVIIERLGWGGLGIARADDGRVILLESPLAIFPGEEVEATVRFKAKHGEGAITRVVSPDPRRAAPLCPVAATCGGCTLWGAGEAAGDLKRTMVEDLLHRSLPHAPPFDWLPAPADARRHRIQLHWDGAILGFHERRSHQVVTVDSCPMASQAVSDAIPALTAALLDGTLPREPARWQLSTGTPGDFVSALPSGTEADPFILRGETWIQENAAHSHAFGDETLVQHPASFFQSCPAWAWNAFRAVFSKWDIGGAALYDVYGGVGFFSRMLKARFERFIVVECLGQAARDAESNLQDMKAQVVRADVSKWLRKGLGTPDDVILLDPARAGLPNPLVEKLNTAGAGRLILIGCDGAAFCRDAKRLSRSWRLERLAAIDLFPNTALVEFAGYFANRRAD